MIRLGQHMVWLVFSAVLLASQQSLYKQIVPNPTLQNGYEEYVQAAEIATSPQVRAMLQWKPGQSYATVPSRGKSPQEKLLQDTLKGLEGKTPLQVKRQLLGQYKSILDLVRKGNQKSVYQPRKTIDTQTTYPELVGFGLISHVAVDCSAALLANGQSAEAARVLADAIDMGSKLPQDTLVTNFVGLTCASAALGGFYSQLDRFSEVDWRFIAERCSAVLDKPLELHKMLEKDSEASLRAFDAYIATGDKNVFRPVFEVTDGDPFLARLGKMSRQELQAARALLAQELQSSVTLLTNSLKGPESKWRYETSDEGTDIEWLTSQMRPSYDQIMVANARVRTQLRLLRLHALIQVHRWHWSELLPDLSTLPAAEVADPLTDGKFQFERSDVGYRLYSKGNSATGEIELSYRRPAPVERVIPPKVVDLRGQR